MILVNSLELDGRVLMSKPNSNGDVKFTEGALAIVVPFDDLVAAMKQFQKQAKEGE